ncbi:AtoC Response regulator containing CheY-like receiver, AAA-type ATPase, and DNA-binding domains [Burkholderiales bacterium]
MTDPIDCNALWLDPHQPAGEVERSRLAASGLRLLPVRTLDDLRTALKTASVVVVRLVGRIELFEEVRALLRGFKQDVPVVCRIHPNEFGLAVEAMRAGACHVIPSDDFSEASWSQALALVTQAVAHMGQSSKGELAKTESVRAEPPAGASVRPAPKTFVFVDPTSQKLLALAQRVAAAQVTTLITGPTGAGKEVLATVIHESSPRASGPFVALNCGAIPEHLMEDMLFGHEKGAYTGAIAQHKGIFEQAQGGTVFLDEIGEMPLVLQAKLLRVLQEKKLTRLGGQQAVEVDFRLVAATNKDLRAAMEAREFREDLYFRISTFRLSIPSLKERPDDILPMAAQFAARQALAQGLTQAPVLTDEALRALRSYAWPGNVRELDNVIQRALVLSHGDRIGLEHLLFDDMPEGEQTQLNWSALPGLSPEVVQVTPVERECSAMNDEPIRLQDAVKTNEHQMILRAIETSPTKAEAAKRLGISPRTLRYKMAQFRIAGAA